MCNLYRQHSGPQAIMDVAKAMSSQVGNLAPGDVYPDYAAPIVRWEGGGEGVELRALGNAVVQEDDLRQRHQAGGQAAGQGRRSRFPEDPRVRARQRHDKCPQHQLIALETVADAGAAMPGSVHGVQRARPRR